jgi:periplasmic protein TonB
MRRWPVPILVAIALHGAGLLLLFAWPRPAPPPAPQLVWMSDLVRTTPPTRTTALAPAPAANSAPAGAGAGAFGKQPLAPGPRRQSPPARPLVTSSHGLASDAGDSNDREADGPSAVGTVAALPGSAALPGLAAAPPVPAAPRSAAQRAAYAAQVRQAVARQQRYPRRARLRGAQGTAQVRLDLESDGQLSVPPRLIASSGWPLLDREAIRMAQAAAPFPPPPSPADLGGVTIVIPIVFTLDSTPN